MRTQSGRQTNPAPRHSKNLPTHKLPRTYLSTKRSPVKTILEVSHKYVSKFHPIRFQFCKTYRQQKLKTEPPIQLLPLTLLQSLPARLWLGGFCESGSLLASWLIDLSLRKLHRTRRWRRNSTLTRRNPVRRYQFWVKWGGIVLIHQMPNWKHVFVVFFNVRY